MIDYVSKTLSISSIMRLIVEGAIVLYASLKQPSFIVMYSHPRTFGQITMAKQKYGHGCHVIRDGSGSLYINHQSGIIRICFQLGLRPLNECIK